MKEIKEKADGLFFCLLELGIGILLLINPSGFTSWIIMSVGIVLMFMGIVEMVRYFRTDVYEAAQSRTMVKGLFMALAGGFCALKTEWFLETFPVITILYGIGILLSGISKIQMTFDMIRQKNTRWRWAAGNAVLSIVCAIIILKSPFSSMSMLWIFTGISLVGEGILDMVTIIMRSSSVQKGTVVDAG